MGGNNCNCKQQFKTYNMSVLTYQVGGNVEVQKNCFAFMFTNLGDTNAFVNGMIVFPSATPLLSLGDSRSISGHELDLFKGKMQIKFGPGANPLLEIVQLFYWDGIPGGPPQNQSSI